MTNIAALERIDSKAAIFWILLLFVFSANISYAYYKYLKLKEFDYATLNAKLISSKELKSKDGIPYFSVLFRTAQMDFRSYSKANMKAFEGRYFKVIVNTKNISFIDLFRSARLKPLSLESTSATDTTQQKFKDFIASQHESEQAKEVYLNLFLNSEVTPSVDEFIVSYGLGAFFAISGLNVALLLAFIFLIVTPIFRLFQDRFFPYMNRELWILLPSFALLLFYAYLTDFTPSFVRAVAASIILFFFALRGEELLNYKTLFLTTAVCLAIFPSFLFSVGFWLSFYGVFLIYLFLANTPFKNKWLIYITLSSWLFAAMLPIIHYIFAVFTKAHLLNSLFGAIFDVFYPLSLAAHILGIGWLFDEWILYAIDSSKNLSRDAFLTPVWFFVFYVPLSFAAAFSKRIFFILNVVVAGYFMGVVFFVYG